LGYDDRGRKAGRKTAGNFKHATAKTSLISEKKIGGKGNQREVGMGREKR